MYQNFGISGNSGIGLAEVGDAEMEALFKRYIHFISAPSGKFGFVI
jgi:hypothetical protein